MCGLLLFQFVLQAMCFFSSACVMSKRLTGLWCCVVMWCELSIYLQLSIHPQILQCNVFCFALLALCRVHCAFVIAQFVCLVYLCFVLWWELPSVFVLQ